MPCHWLQLTYQCLSYGVKSLSPRQCLSASMHMKLDHAVSRLGISTFSTKNNSGYPGIRGIFNVRGFNLLHRKLFNLPQIYPFRMCVS